MENNFKKPIEDLSNMVFGLALTIGALGLAQQITLGFQFVIGSLISFFLSFILLVFIWLRYVTILSLIKIEKRIELDLNVMLLFLVIIEPYLFNLLINAPTSSDADFSSILYAFDVGMMLLILGLLYTIAIRNSKTKEIDLLKEYRSIKNRLFGIGSIFLISVLPIFWQIILFNLSLRFILWIVAVGIVFLYRNIGLIEKKFNVKQVTPKIE